MDDYASDAGIIPVDADLEMVILFFELFFLFLFLFLVHYDIYYDILSFILCA